MIKKTEIFVSKNTKIFETLMRKDMAKNLNSDFDSYVQNNNYYFRSASNQLMLRDHPHNKTLILAVISLNNQHIGTGTKILTILEALAKEYKYKYVEIESILTPEMWSLAEKCNFKKQQYNALKQLKE